MDIVDRLRSHRLDGRAELPMGEVAHLLTSKPAARETSAARSELGGIARSGALMISGGVGGTLATFVLVTVVARTLGVTQAGLYFQAVGLVTTGSVLAAWGAASGLVRAVSRELALGHRRLGPTFRVSLVPVATFAGVLTVAGVAAAPGLAALITSGPNTPAMTRILWAIIPALPFMALTRAMVAAARGAGASHPTVLFDTGGQPLLRLGLCVCAGLVGAPVWVYALGWTLASVLCCAGAAVSLRRSVQRAGASLAGTVGPADRAEFWRFAGPRGLEEIFQATNAWLLIVVVGALASARDAAVYAAVSRIAVASTIVLTAVISATGPRISRAFARHDHASARYLYQTVTTWLVAVSFPIPTLLILFPGGLLGLISPDLRQGSLALEILAGAMLFNLVTGPVGSVLMMAGKSTWNLYNAMIGVAVMLALAVVLVPHEGALGAAIAWGSSIAVQNVVAVVQIWRGFRMQPVTVPACFAALRGIAAALIGGLIARRFCGDSVAGLMAGIVLAVTLLFTASWRFSGGPRETLARFLGGTSIAHDTELPHQALRTTE